MKGTLTAVLAALIALTLAACGPAGVSESGSAAPADTGAGAAASAARSEPADAGAEVSGRFSEERIARIKQALKVPEDVETEVVIDYDHPSYWEGAGINLLRCEVLRDGKTVASALVRQDTGEIARDIRAYEADG